MNESEAHSTTRWAKIEWHWCHIEIDIFSLYSFQRDFWESIALCLFKHFTQKPLAYVNNNVKHEKHWHIKMTAYLVNTLHSAVKTWTLPSTWMLLLTLAFELNKMWRGPVGRKSNPWRPHPMTRRAKRMHCIGAKYFRTPSDVFFFSFSSLYSDRSDLLWQNEEDLLSVKQGLILLWIIETLAVPVQEWMTKTGWTNYVHFCFRKQVILHRCT